MANKKITDLAALTAPNDADLVIVEDVSEVETKKATLAELRDVVAGKQNLAAAVAPTVNEDSSAGYSVGSRWIDTTADRAYVCVDASVGAAVWLAMQAGPKSNYAAVGAPAVGNDNTQGYARGSLWVDNFNKQTYVATDVVTGAAVWVKWAKPSALTPAAVAAAGSIGTSLDHAREDHAHAHGDQAGGSLHAVATPAAAGFMPVGTPITESTTARTLTDADHGRTILCTHASGCAVDVPGTLTPGFVCTLIQRGAAQVTATGSGGLTMTPAPTFLPTTNELGSAMTVFVESATVGNAFGDLAAA